jgi:L-lactate dehydrogenase complex protein LldG
MVECPKMTVSSSSRDRILGRIRHALRDIPAAETPGDVTVAREYRMSDTMPHEQVIEQFLEKVAEYRATVHRVSTSELAERIASCLASRGVTNLVTPADVPDDWVPAGVHRLRDPGLSYTDLDTSDGVMTGCVLGIAQTGTIVLDGGEGQGRRALSLLPDYHLCIVPADQIVHLVPEAVSRLAPISTRPLTWISGPSATSDIELSRVEGVHGPRTLEVIVVDG